MSLTHTLEILYMHSKWHAQLQLHIHKVVNACKAHLHSTVVTRMCAHMVYVSCILVIFPQQEKYGSTTVSCNEGGPNASALIWAGSEAWPPSQWPALQLGRLCSFASSAAWQP